MKFGKRSKRFLALLPVAAAVVIVMLLVRTRSGPTMKAEHEFGRPLRVIHAPAVALVPRALGYGIAEPVRVWRAVAEVKGTVVEVHSQLKAGVLIENGTLLLRINPADYELAAARFKARIAETEARLEELAAEERNKTASLEIEQRSLALAEKSLARLNELLGSEIVPPDQVDREERNVLQQEQAIQQIESALAVMPARRAALTAALDVLRADLEQAKLDVSRTVIQAPFDCRLGEVAIEKGQFLTAGQQLFEAHGTDGVEIEAKFRPEQLRSLLSAESRQPIQSDIAMETLREILDLEVSVRLRSGEWEAVWPARFERIREVVDSRTRAINVVAVVDDPYDKIIPGVRPALVRGMYCEVELRAPMRPDTIVLPRIAVRNSQVFVVDADDRLQARSVAVAFAQGDLLVIESGLDPGERVVITPPIPATEGTKVEPVVDTDLTERIIRQAQGQEEPR